VTKATDNFITLLPFISSREFDLWIYYWMYIKWQWHTANVCEWQLVSWPFCQLRVQSDIALSSIHISLYQQVVINRVHRMRFCTLPWHVTHHCTTCIPFIPVANDEFKTGTIQLVMEYSTLYFIFNIKG
jgi:hypothetical protein